MSVAFYIAFIVVTGIERLAELSISKSNRKYALERGGKEYGQGHFPWMVVLHVGLLVACVAEVVLLNRPFIPWLGWPMFVVAILCQAGRYWVVRSLGKQWNTRVIVVPGAERVTDRGPYRWISHPNYWIVAIEGIALPLVHTAWITAIVFTVLNAILLLAFRLPTENRALRELV